MTEHTRAAQSSRELLSACYGNLPEYYLPVDPIDISRRLGINVYESRMPNDVSGLIVRESRGADVDIFLNSQHAPVRQRFTCAHEIGHYVDLSNRGLSEAAFYRRRDQASSCGTHAEEIFANQFAAYLLMPARQFRSYVAQGTDNFALSQIFNVSLDSIGHHMTNLHLA